MYDVVVVGAGPAGLTAVTNTSLRGLKSLVIEKQEIPGGLPRILYPDKIIRDHPGFPVGILGKELSRMLFMQAKNAGAEIRLGEEVLKVVKGQHELLEVRTVEDKYQAKRVIICTGIYDIPRKLEILEDYAGANVHYKIESPRIFEKKRVLIVGGGDHAFDTAVQLKDITEDIIVVVKDRYAKAKENTVKLAEEIGIRVLYNTEIVRILEDRRGKLDRVQVADKETGGKEILTVDELFIAIGFKPTRRFLEDNSFELREKGAVKVQRNLQTNIKGVFAAGDVTGEVRVIATACAEGIVAAVHAFEEVKKPYWLR